MREAAPVKVFLTKNNNRNTDKGVVAGHQIKKNWTAGLDFCGLWTVECLAVNVDFYRFYCF